jgi:hypothetical protein
VPLLQTAVAPVTLVVHTWPQLPQLFGSVFSFAHAPLQTVSPAVVQVQLPFVHVVPGGHLLPHAPQLLMSVGSGAHVLPHKVSPVVAVMQLHPPPVQVAPTGHALPHAPQLARSVIHATSQPSDVLLLQWMNPVLHTETAQLDPAQCHVALPPWHAIAQPPQFLMSTVSSTQRPLHRLGGFWHTQTPPTQLAPVWQVLPQAPQLAGSLVSSTHVLLQSLSGVAHVHTPAAQCVPAGHLLLHAPQLTESTLRSAQAPLPATRGSTPQMASTSVGLVAGGLQVHAPLTQSAPGGHLVPHAPQLFGSLALLTHVIVIVAPTGHIDVAPVHMHTPLGWQPIPAAHILPQLPQFVGS